MPRPVRWIVPIVGVLTLVLAGCAAPSGTGEPAATLGASAGAEGNSAAEAAEDEPKTGAGCIVGTWLLNNNTFADLMTEMDIRLVDEVTGTARFRAFADGTSVTEYVDWANIATVNEGQAVVTMTRNGEDTGVYTAESDGTFSLQEVNNASTMVVETSVAGAVVSQQALTGSPSTMHQAVFSCSGDELTITVDGASSIMIRER